MYLMLITLISLTMITTKSPIMMGLYIFFQALLFSLMISSMSFSTWTAYMLFIVCLGGVLIVFLYVIMTLTIGMDPGKLGLSTLIFLFLMSFFEKNDLSNSENTEMSKIIFEMKFQESSMLEKICSISNFKFSILLMTLLFISMLIVVNLTNKKSSSTMKI